MKRTMKHVGSMGFAILAGTTALSPLAYAGSGAVYQSASNSGSSQAISAASNQNVMQMVNTSSNSNSNNSYTYQAANNNNQVTSAANVSQLQSIGSNSNSSGSSSNGLSTSALAAINNGLTVELPNNICETVTCVTLPGTYTPPPLSDSRQRTRLRNRVSSAENTSTTITISGAQLTPNPGGSGGSGFPEMTVVGNGGLTQLNPNYTASHGGGSNDSPTRGGNYGEVTSYYPSINPGAVTTVEQAYNPIIDHGNPGYGQVTNGMAEQLTTNQNNVTTNVSQTNNNVLKGDTIQNVSSGSTSQSVGRDLASNEIAVSNVNTSTSNLGGSNISVGKGISIGK